MQTTTHRQLIAHHVSTQGVCSWNNQGQDKVMFVHVGMLAPSGYHTHAHTHAYTHLCVRVVIIDQLTPCHVTRRY